jgi:hypothetical protein
MNLGFIRIRDLPIHHNVCWQIWMSFFRCRMGWSLIGIMPSNRFLHLDGLVTGDFRANERNTIVEIGSNYVWFECLFGLEPRLALLLSS